MNARNRATILTLQPEVAAMARRVVEASLAAGIVLTVYSGNRTFAQQRAIFAQGRSVPGRIVTKVNAGGSRHNFGLAFDCVRHNAAGIIDWKLSLRPVAAIAKVVAPALTWGGSWRTFHDPNHFEDARVALVVWRNRFPNGWRSAV